MALPNGSKSSIEGKKTESKQRKVFSGGQVDSSTYFCTLTLLRKLTITGETVEKVPKQILGGDAEKNNLTECATINNLIIMKGHDETPKNQALTILKGFSTVSVETSN